MLVTSVIMFLRLENAQSSVSNDESTVFMYMFIQEEIQYYTQIINRFILWIYSSIKDSKDGNTQIKPLAHYLHY